MRSFWSFFYIATFHVFFFQVVQRKLSAFKGINLVPKYLHFTFEVNAFGIRHSKGHSYEWTIIFVQSFTWIQKMRRKILYLLCVSQLKHDCNVLSLPGFSLLLPGSKDFTWDHFNFVVGAKQAYLQKLNLGVRLRSTETDWNPNPNPKPSTTRSQRGQRHKHQPHFPSNPVQ